MKSITRLGVLIVLYFYLALAVAVLSSCASQRSGCKNTNEKWKQHRTIKFKGFL